MKKQLNGKQLEEMNFQYDWMETIIKFYIEIGDKLFEDVLQSLHKLRTLNNLSAVRQNFEENNIMVMEELTPKQLTELNLRLKEKFGKTLWDVNKKLENKINNIAKRGRLRNEEEFYLMKNYMDTITDVPEKEILCSTLEKITGEFEMK